MARMRKREFRPVLEEVKEPVRQKGCWKEALGRKYFSIVWRWIEGEVWVRAWMIGSTSRTAEINQL